MEKEELIQFLRENLSVQISMDYEYDYGWKNIITNVSLLIGDEEISSHTDSIPIKD